MPDPNFRFTLALVNRERFLLLLRSMILHNLIAFLLLEDTTFLLHLLGLVLVTQQILTGDQRILQFLFDVDSVALFVGGLWQRILLVLGGAPRLAHPSLIKGLGSRL